MPREEVLKCAVDGKVIQPEPELGDRQGGLTEIKHGATTWQLVLCSDCKKPLFELYRPHVELVLPGGTAQGADKLNYLPVKEA